MKIVSTAELPLANQQDLLKTFPNDNFTFLKDISEAKDYLSSTEVLITYGVDLSEDVLNQLPSLKWVMVIAAGIDQLPFEALDKRDILVTSAKGIHKAPMSEYVLFMMMFVYRQGKTLIENEKNRVWTRNINMEEITGKKVLIAGTGILGKEIAKIAKAFQMKTIGVSKSGRPIEYFDENISQNNMTDYLPEADFIVSILPSTSDTKSFFKYEHFQAMPRHAVFINVGRGDAVQDVDLLKAMDDEEIAHAVLDVFETEPLPLDHPYWEKENITVTTHLSGVSPHYHNRAIDIFKQNYKAFKKAPKEMMNVVSTQKGY